MSGNDLFIYFKNMLLNKKQCIPILLFFQTLEGKIVPYLQQLTEKIFFEETNLQVTL